MQGEAGHPKKGKELKKKTREIHKRNQVNNASKWNPSVSRKFRKDRKKQRKEVSGEKKRKTSKMQLGRFSARHESKREEL